MNLSSKANQILSQFNSKNTKLGDIRNLAKEIKKDHHLAMELWSSEQFFARLLALLIIDRKLLQAELIDNLLNEMRHHAENEKLQLVDWLMANQLTKDKKTIALIESWHSHPCSLHRRIFWYYQGRLRWTGQTPPANTEWLLDKIETEIETEEPEVQWAMNFLAGWIGVFDKKYRARCVQLGERTGLYRGIKVSKGCTPAYLPEFIAIESSKRNL